MTTRHGLASLLACLFLSLPACDEDDGGGDDGANETDSTIDDDGGESGDTNASNASNASNTSSDSADSDDSNDSNDSNASDDSDAMTCDGGWYLGSVPFSGDAFIEQCDDNPPTICLTGTYIVFDDGDCFCLPECSQAGLSEGDACTNDGSVTCTRIENDEGGSSGVFCVPPEWGLCG
jgi:hypothetical protein